MGGFFSPVHDVYGKQDLLPVRHRLELLRLAIADSNWMHVAEWECRRCKYSRSYEVVDQLVAHNEDYAAATVLFACGADVFEAMLDPSKWPLENVGRLLQRAIIVVVARSDKNMQTLEHSFKNIHNSDNVWIIDGVTSNISSSLIR